MSGTGLSPYNISNVAVNFSPIGGTMQNFGALMMIGYSTVIPIATRYRTYTTLSAVAADFGTTAAEYLGANAFFAQSPQPAFIKIGRWAKNGAAGTNTGGYIAPSLQAAFITSTTAVANGGMAITLGGTLKTLASVTFASATQTMAGLAAVMNTALSPATCTWDAVNNNFIITTSGTSAALGSITYGSAAAGTDLSVLFKFTLATGATLSQGIDTESALTAVTTIRGMDTSFYGVAWALSAMGDISDANMVLIGNFIEGASPPTIMAATTTEAGAVSSASTTDLAYLLWQATLERTFCQYSSTSLYAAISAFARGFTVDFTANNTTITLMFKQEPTIVSELLSQTQADALKAKNCNVFTRYSNNTAIIQYGVMANGFFFDEVQGTDWLAANIQTRIYNRLYSTPKVPQTDAGVHTLVTENEAACQDGVNNGLIAPGVWNGPPIGPIVTGQYLPNGYYVYVPPIATQSSVDRAARKAPTQQTLIKLAGAVHKADVIVNVNR